MIYTKTDKTYTIYKVKYFGGHYYEVMLPEGINIQDYNKKYKIQNYKGHFTLILHKVDSNVEYRLHYKDILVGSFMNYFNMFFVMYSILTKINLDSWLFEHKVKKEEILEFFQYFIWDKNNTNEWYMNQFNQKYHEKSNLSIDNYKGKISIKNGILFYKKEEIFDFNKTSDGLTIRWLRFISTIGLNECDLLGISNEVNNEFYNFKKYVMGSSDEMLESWIDKKSITSKIKDLFHRYIIKGGEV